jgi:hypothetical protein
MVAAALSAASLVLVVTLERHRAVAWPVAERAEMARKLEALGTSITDLSDVREHCGLLRMSSMDPSSRWAVRRSSWRLGELRAVYAQARALQIAAE